MGAAIKVLGIVGSPRPDSNTEWMVREALEAAKKTGNVETDIFLLCEKTIAPCNSCWLCIERRRCVVGDDLHELLKKWLRADAVLIGSPVYHMSMSANLKAAIDRLGNSLLAGRYKFRSPRFMKVVGALAQGGDRYGGVEFTLQSIINSALLMNCVPVPGDYKEPGDTPAYIGAAGYTHGQIEVRTLDEASLIGARNVGQRVAEVAKIIRAGREAVKDNLPPEYFLDLEY